MPASETSESRSFNSSVSHRSFFGKLAKYDLKRKFYEKLEDFKGKVLLYKEPGFVVYRARCAYSNGVVVLKGYSRETLTLQTRQRVWCEVQALQASHCPFILKCFDSFEDQGWWWLVLENCAAGDLYRITQTQPVISEGWLVSQVLLPLLQTLAYLHNEGIIHRDVKPEHVLFNSEKVAKLSGFFLSQDVTKFGFPRDLVGSLDYVAPEVFKISEAAKQGQAPAGGGMLTYDYKVDVWMLGILTYDVLVGRPPFNAEQPADTVRQVLEEEPEFPDEVTDDAADFILCCLSKDPADRPTARQLLSHPWVQDNISWAPPQGFVDPVPDVDLSYYNNGRDDDDEDPDEAMREDEDDGMSGVAWWRPGTWLGKPAPARDDLQEDPGPSRPGVVGGMTSAIRKLLQPGAGTAGAGMAGPAGSSNKVAPALPSFPQGGSATAAVHINGVAVKGTATESGVDDADFNDHISDDGEAAAPVLLQPHVTATSFTAGKAALTDQSGRMRRAGSGVPGLGAKGGSGSLHGRAGTPRGTAALPPADASVSTVDASAAGSTPRTRAPDGPATPNPLMLSPRPQLLPDAEAVTAAVAVPDVVEAGGVSGWGLAHNNQPPGKAAPLGLAGLAGGRPGPPAAGSAAAPGKPSPVPPLAGGAQGLAAALATRTTTTTSQHDMQLESARAEEAVAAEDQAVASSLAACEGQASNTPAGAHTPGALSPNPSWQTGSQAGVSVPAPRKFTASASASQSQVRDAEAAALRRFTEATASTPAAQGTNMLPVGASPRSKQRAAAPQPSSHPVRPSPAGSVPPGPGGRGGRTRGPRKPAGSCRVAGHRRTRWSWRWRPGQGPGPRGRPTRCTVAAAPGPTPSARPPRRRCTAT